MTCAHVTHRGLGGVALWIAVLASDVLAASPRIIAGKEVEQASSADRAGVLVQQALAAKLAGDMAAHHKLLADAVKADPEYAPARWHSGQVQFQGAWRSLTEMSDMASNNRRLNQYRDLRQMAADIPADHLALAQWCMRVGLVAEERFHWTRVLQADSSHQQARDRLNLRSYRGGLFTPEQIADQIERRKQAKRDFAKYEPIFRAVCRCAVNSESTDRDAAIDEIRQVTDPAAIEALESAVARECRDADPEVIRELNLAVVAALANMSEHDVTIKLLNYSFFATDSKVRHLAGQSLKGRPVTDYVPLLMGALSAPIEARIDTFTSPDGTVLYGENLYQPGPEADVAIVRSQAHFTIAPRNERGETNAAAAVHARQVAAAHEAALARQRVAAANAQTFTRNQRVREVLRDALDMDLGTDPQAYWQAWTDYNELSYDEHPTYTYEDYNVSTQYVQPPTTHSCFMAGTPVWTREGPQPIEKIMVGDMVLAQHPITGEIAFRPVAETTLGPPTKTVELTLPGEIIVATPGHRFWVEGRGWEMAKALQIAMPLHALSASLGILSIESGEELQCHNLVVDEFHTFFVGTSKLLVHDKSCPRPTLAALPGGTKQAPSISALSQPVGATASANP